MPKKKDVLTKEMKKYIREMLMPEIEKLDLKSWQKACKSFGPFSYKETTRKQWFEKNKEKIPVAETILSFHDKYKTIMKEDEKLKKFKLKICTNYMIELIREAQEAAGIKANKINSVKIASFHTLVKFHKDPSKLEEGLYEGKEKLPKDKRVTRSYRRGRKKEKGEYKPPEIVLEGKGSISSQNRLEIPAVMINDYLYPYQNISISFESQDKLELKKAKGYEVSDGKLIIEFLQASLDIEPYEEQLSLEFEVKKSAKSYTVMTTITYDNCDTGLRDTEASVKHKIKIS